MSLLLLVALLGCPKKDPGPMGPGGLRGEVDVLEASDANLGREVRPGAWSGPGVSLRVPGGWWGREGRPGGEQLLWIEHVDSGIRVEVFSRKDRGPLAPGQRPDCAWSFQDSSRWRKVMVARGGPTLSATCIPEDPLGPVVQGWFGASGGRQLHVEVTYPAGRLLEGRVVAAPVLRSIQPL